MTRRVLHDASVTPSSPFLSLSLSFPFLQLVLVGDPQQLPATLFSTQTRGSGLDRSLFERLQQAGLPCILLSIQYRMHPQIRTFPSDYFYQGRLVDGISVLRAPPAAFYRSPSGLLQPYRVFDVEGGRENGGKSKSNQQEADFAVALFWELRTSLAIESQRRQQLGQPPVERTEVGIVTPYRSQRDLIRATFDRLLGARSVMFYKISTEPYHDGLVSCLPYTLDLSSGFPLRSRSRRWTASKASSSTSSSFRA